MKLVEGKFNHAVVFTDIIEETAKDKQEPTNAVFQTLYRVDRTNENS